MNKPSRRTFMKYTSAAAAGMCLMGNAQAEPAPSANLSQPFRIHMDTPADPRVQRVFTILRDRLTGRGLSQVVEASAANAADLMLRIDPALFADAFRIDDAAPAIRITGGSPRGLLYGAGAFLRTCQFGASRFQASAWRGESIPRGSLRGMYFATHFHNWYHQAPDAEITRYVEDLALWGVNAIMVIFPMINLTGWDDPQAKPAMDMVRRYIDIIKGLGLQFVTSVNNTMFSGAPDAIRATRLPDPLGRRGNSGHPICPSHPEGHAYLMDNARRFYEELPKDSVDYLCYWPYDEGGCACPQCLPWGSNGYLRISRDFTQLGRQYFPNMKTILSTWMFDTPPEGEWQGLADALAKENGWVDYILADAHEDFPRYPLDNGVPGQLPLLNFPEISMWGNWPWGGFGANPLPGRFQRLWDQVKQTVQGGLPYSEGIYEDMNKAIEAQFYWNPSRSARDTLKEYIQYEFGAGVEEDVLALVDCLEKTASCSYQKKPVDQAVVARAYACATAVNSRLPEWARKNWRWEILNLRALLDRERFDGGSLTSPEAEAALLRLIEIYHAQLETDDPYHHRVRPPLKRAISRNGEK